jgi:peroxin-6
MEKTLDLSMIAEKCPKNLTGADFYALCSDAMLNALKRKIFHISFIGEGEMRCETR